MSAPVSDGWKTGGETMPTANVNDYPGNPPVLASPSSSAEARGRKRQDRRRVPYNGPRARKNRRREDNVSGTHENETAEASTSSTTPPSSSRNYYKYLNQGQK